MNVIGVGVDLVDLDRIARLLANRGDQAMQRFFTDEERAYLATRPEATGHAAARIAAKEAVYKALQGSPEARGIGWREIEVVRAADGRPAPWKKPRLTRRVHPKVDVPRSASCSPATMMR